MVILHKKTFGNYKSVGIAMYTMTMIASSIWCKNGLIKYNINSNDVGWKVFATI